MGKVDLKIDADVLAKAKAAGLDAVRVAEQALRVAVASADASKAMSWAQKNADALRDHEQRIAIYGVFGEDLRTW